MIQSLNGRLSFPETLCDTAVPEVVDVKAHRIMKESIKFRCGGVFGGGRCS